MQANEGNNVTQTVGLLKAVTNCNNVKMWLISSYKWSKVYGSDCIQLPICG